MAVDWPAVLLIRLCWLSTQQLLLISAELWLQVKSEVSPRLWPRLTFWGVFVTLICVLCRKSNIVNYFKLQITSQMSFFYKYRGYFTIKCMRRSSNMFHRFILRQCVWNLGWKWVVIYVVNLNIFSAHPFDINMSRFLHSICDYYL